MKKEKDSVIKNLLNLKEDYLLNLDDYKDSDNLTFKEDEKDSEEKNEDPESEEKNEDPESDETDEDEESEESNEDEDTDDKESEDKKKGKKDGDDKKPEPKVAESPFVKVDGLANIFTKMKKAQSPADVGLSLKDFLTKIRKESVDSLIVMKNKEQE